MNINLSLSTGVPFEINPISKVSSSQDTDGSQVLSFGKRISFVSCASSLSIEEKEVQHIPENQIFARYLFAQGSSRQSIVFQEMKALFSAISKEKIPQKHSFLGLKEFQFSEQEQVMEHFIGEWFIFMGYSSSHNKKYFTKRMILFAGAQRISTFTRLYSNLSLLKMQKQQRFHFLIRVCKNGWQFFIKQLLRRQEKLELKK